MTTLSLIRLFFKWLDHIRGASKVHQNPLLYHKSQQFWGYLWTIVEFFEFPLLTISSEDKTSHLQYQKNIPIQLLKEILWYMISTPECAVVKERSFSILDLFSYWDIVCFVIKKFRKLNHFASWVHFEFRSFCHKKQVEIVGNLQMQTHPHTHDKSGWRSVSLIKKIQGKQWAAAQQSGQDNRINRRIWQGTEVKEYKYWEGWILSKTQLSWLQIIKTDLSLAGCLSQWG